MVGGDAVANRLFSTNSCSVLLLLFFIFLLRPHPVSPARLFPTDVTSIPNPNPWGNFSKLIDIEKGTSLHGISILKQYFTRFGYLTTTSSNLTNNDFFDSDLESALLSYQTNLGLPLTGKLDSTTLTQLSSPRCGIPDTTTTHHHDDTSSTFSTTRRYAYFSGRPRWFRPTPMTLTYAFSPSHTTPYLSQPEIRTVFRRSFNRWSSVIPVTFTETSNYPTADVKIGFYGGDHGDDEPFDGELGILAHAFSPENGMFHLDSAETWAVDFDEQKSGVAVDLESVVTHEIGHVLGLAHSSVKDSIMYPSLSPRTKKVELRIDDVEGVQALYGSNPNFNATSFLEAEMTSKSSAFAGGRRKWGSFSVGLWISTAAIILMFS